MEILFVIFLLRLWCESNSESLRYYNLYLDWVIPEKSLTGELRTWNFQVYWRKNMRKFQGLIKKEVEFPGVFNKSSCGISMGLGFWPWNFQRVSHNFAGFPVTNLKIPGFFFQKSISSIPLFGFFFWIAHFLFIHEFVWFCDSLRVSFLAN